MTPLEHPNLTRLRQARIGLDMAQRLFRAEVKRTMAERGGAYTAEAVATAADVTRSRIYQILKERRATQ